MAISPIGAQIYTALPANNAEKPVAKEVSANNKIENNSKPELSIGIQFSEKTGTARISTSLKNCFDTNMWYTIYKDGSGESIGAWGRGVKYPKGTFSETYGIIKEAFKDGKTPDDTASKEIYDAYKKAEDYAMENFKVCPIDLRV